MIRFALRNLLARRVRTFLALLGLAVAIAGLVGLISFAVGLRSLIGDTAQEVGGIIVLQKGMIAAPFSRLVDKDAAAAAAVPGVRQVSRDVISVALLVDGQFTPTRGVMSQLLILGVDPRERLNLTGGGVPARYLSRGENLPLEPSDRVLISSTIARDYGKELDSLLDVQGVPFQVCGVYESGNFFIDKMIVMHIDRARELLKLSGDAFTAMYVEAEDPQRTGDVARAIEDAVPGVTALPAEEFASQLSDLSQNIDLVLLVITSFAVVVGAIGIANTQLMSVTERVGEFGVLRATGWQRTHVLRLVVTESLVLGTLGGLAGVALGALAASVIARVVPVAPVLSWSLAGEALLLSAVMGTLGGVYPAYRAAAMDPVRAMRFRDL